MIASDDDNYTWKAGGAAARRRIGYKGDNDVGRAMDRNKQNVDYFVLSGAEHYPIDEYLRHGLVDAMQKGAHHWGLDNTPVGDIVYGRPVETGLQGDIRAKWETLGGAQGFLGKPQTGVITTPDNKGLYAHFQGGSIYWTHETGAYEVHGAIRRKWKSLGWERSFLGYPTTDETATPDKKGRYNHFQGGSIYWTHETGAYEVHGAIRRKWKSLGWERSFLGYPVSDEMSTPDGVGRMSRFKGGTIYWTRQKGAWVEKS